MEDTLTVRELVELLQQVDQNLPVYISGLGVTLDDSWLSPLIYDLDTVDVYDNFCRINISAA
jgi:hypothetical protein